MCNSTTVTQEVEGSERDSDQQKEGVSTCKVRSIVSNGQQHCSEGKQVENSERDSDQILQSASNPYGLVSETMTLRGGR